MSDEIFVKICGVTSEADALLAVAFGADAVGFIFAPSPRQVTASLVADIVKRLPHGIVTVGVFRDEAASRVVEVTNTVGLQMAQLHGHETPADCRWIRERVPATIKAFSAGDRTIGRFLEFGADYLLIDGAQPGSGEVFDWRLAEGVVDPGRLIVSGGLRADNVGAAISHLHPFGVDVASGVESSPGRKDPRKLREFVHAARAAARAAAEAAEANAPASTRPAELAGSPGATGSEDRPGPGEEGPEVGESVVSEPYDWGG